MLCINSRNGQWLRTFQITFGRKIRKAASPPIQSHLLRKMRRCRVNRSPPTTARPKIAIEYFSSKPSPATTPKENQQRASRLIATIAKYEHPIHSNGSNEFVVSRLPSDK